MTGPDYENRPSDFHAFRLLKLNPNSSIFAGKSAYTLIGTYELPSSGLQKLIEVGTILGNKAYSVQYIADAPQYSDYLPIVQKMFGSLVIKNSIETGIGPIPDNSTKLYPHNCRPTNPVGWFHYNNTWERKGMMGASTCDLGYGIDWDLHKIMHS